MNTKHTTKGFTIIEVVLVLAIAGLIFLMVFVALPALQAGQRDTARKSDVGIVATAINTFTSSNRRSPTSAAEVAKYVDKLSANIDTPYTEGILFNDTSAGKTTMVDGKIYVSVGKKCPDVLDGTQDLKPGTRAQAAVSVKLEGGSGSIFCQDV